MGLQSDNLTALGLGITADQPPIPLQSAVRKGIHLRYATSFEKGLPWLGFYLFRRQHVAALTRCLAPELAGLKPGLTGAMEHAFKEASLYSPAPIEFIDEFPTPGSAEVALPVKETLGARFAQAPVHRVTAKIGFRGSVPQSGGISGFIQFLAREPWPPADPLSESGVIFSSGDPQRPGTSWPLKFGHVGAWNALGCAPKGEGPATLEIVPPASCEYAVLVVSHPFATL